MPDAALAGVPIEYDPAPLGRDPADPKERIDVRDGALGRWAPGQVEGGAVDRRRRTE
jgi:hypothetical protein